MKIEHRETVLIQEVFFTNGTGSEKQETSVIEAGAETLISHRRNDGAEPRSMNLVVFNRKLRSGVRRAGSRSMPSYDGLGVLDESLRSDFQNHFLRVKPSFLLCRLYSYRRQCVRLPPARMTNSIISGGVLTNQGRVASYC